MICKLTCSTHTHEIIIYKSRKKKKWENVRRKRTRGWRWQKGKRSTRVQPLHTHIHLPPTPIVTGGDFADGGGGGGVGICSKLWKMLSVGTLLSYISSSGAKWTCRRVCNTSFSFIFFKSLFWILWIINKLKITIKLFKRYLECHTPYTKRPLIH